jgi:hypothetical protein
VYRDPSAWYHVVIAFDSTQATASNRVKIYVNGSQVTALANTTYPSQNYDSDYNMTTAQYLGVRGDGGLDSYFDGYLTEINSIDGQALTPTSFGQINAITGVWQPKKYAGTYGTNGFYLNFSDNSAATAAAIGKDYSGNGNNWTPNNISVTAGVTYDSMIDTPTPYADGGNGRGNYAVLNPLTNFSGSDATISNGNLTVAYGSSATIALVAATVGQSSGKWYYEFICTASSATNPGWLVGIVKENYTVTADFPGQDATGWGCFGLNGNKYNGAGGVSYGSAFIVNDILMCAYDIDSGKIWWGKNGTWFASGDPTTGTNAAFTNIGGNTLFPAIGDGGGAGTYTGSLNFGQRPFTYTPPSGFLALNTQNLPASTIDNGAAYMAATLYTGNGGTLAVSNAVNGVSFQPDLVWLKSRSAAYDHLLFDAIRGTGKALFSSSTAAETTTNNMSAFNSNGFTALYNATYIGSNNSGVTMVGWQWKAGGAAVTNTAGSISSQVSANVSAGFSVVTYTGTGANATVGHGLGVAAKMVIIKSRSGVRNWQTYHASIGNTGALYLNTTSATVTATTNWNNTSPTSTVFSVGTDGNVNANTETYVAYCFAEVAGYSKFGSYTGNGSTDGPFVYLGFRPRFVMIKRTDTGGTGWALLDSSRDPENVVDQYLAANLSDAEAVYANDKVDFLSNGFKQRGTASGQNGSGGTFIYMAFAENPFSKALAR